MTALTSGCGSEDESIGDRALSPAETWSAQREAAKSILATYPGQPSPIAITGAALLSATADPATTRISVTFTGARETASTPCGADYAGEAVESAAVVVVIVLEQRNSSGGVCTMQGTTRTATLNLARPLGNRELLDLQAQVVPVRTAYVPD
ncbi:hypothetical protein GCM10010435_58390 [Winogradskya consettensis]|uniref:Uncharacterized protein n=1 Tax=Winogradskya consettensis TaxID=113560 RepID=A0A919S9P9_9ACTN|nr:hypothetical protein [Actinoplanes consettensis]GIM66907.1 hypothetical protein Aco04nite_03930 [Actinoplanes consettensis]